MTIFVRAHRGGIIPLSQIAGIAHEKRDRDGNTVFSVTTPDGAQAEIWEGALERLIVAMIPAEGWECFTPYTEAGSRRPAGITAEPIIAWGLSPLGAVAPIMPTTLDMKRECESLALRKAGSPRVYESHFGWFEDEAEWLTELRRYFDQQQAQRETKTASPAGTPSEVRSQSPES